MRALKFDDKSNKLTDTRIAMKPNYEKHEKNYINIYHNQNA